MGDLGMHVLHMPLRAGWYPSNVRALLSKVITERPGPGGAMVPCETWDNATLACEVVMPGSGESHAGEKGKEGYANTRGKGQHFPMLLEMKRIAPGGTNTWYLRVLGTAFSAEFSTKYPKTLRSMAYVPGASQSWQVQATSLRRVSPIRSCRCGQPIVTNRPIAEKCVSHSAA